MGTIVKTIVYGALEILNSLYCHFVPSSLKSELQQLTLGLLKREREQERERERDCMTTLMGTMSGQYMGWKLNGDGAMVEVVVLKAWWW